jgi:hypothetical protein
VIACINGFESCGQLVKTMTDVMTAINRTDLTDDLAGKRGSACGHAEAGAEASA